jgi:hypothetical protein
MYVVVTETVLRLHAPPPDCPVVRVCHENAVIDHRHFVYVLHVAHEHVLFLNSIVWVHVVNPHSVVETCNYQFLAHDVSHVHRNTVSPHLLLVPKQYHFVFVSCYQYAAQYQTHPHRFLMVG